MLPIFAEGNPQIEIKPKTQIWYINDLITEQ